MNIVSCVTDSLLTSCKPLPCPYWEGVGFWSVYSFYGTRCVKLSETALQSLFCKYASIAIGSLDTSITKILFSFTYRIPLLKEITGRSFNRVIDIYIQR